MKHVRKPNIGGGNPFYRVKKGGPHQTLCGAPATIYDHGFKAFQTPTGVARLGDVCPECARLRLEVSPRPQENQKHLRLAAKRAAGCAR